MSDAPSIGERLALLRDRAGLSLDEVASRGGYGGRSSVQRFFNRRYDPALLPMPTAQRLARALAGSGSPPVIAEEVLALAGLPAGQAGIAFALPEALAEPARLARDIPIFGTALGSEGRYDGLDGAGSHAVEQAALDQSEVLGHLRRAPALVGRKDVYGVYISGSSMYPRFGDGESVIVDPKRPPMIGDDVIVHLCAPDDHEGDRVNAVLIKRLVRRTASYVALEQFNPPLTFRIESRKVKSIHRIIPATELLA